MILYLLLFISVFLDTLKNTYYNHFGKNQMEKSQDSLLFNMVCCVGSVVFLLIIGSPLKISGYSLIMSVIFAVVTVGAQYFSLLAMSMGSMSFSVLFTYLSMIIPTLFGIIYYKQPISTLQLIGLVLMILTFILSIDLKSGSGVTIKWLIVVFANFVAWGLVGVCQQLHQNSIYAHELKTFLLWSFTFSAIMFGIVYLVTKKKSRQKESSAFKLKTKSSVLAMLTGAVIGAVNIINLYLSGKMPGVVFFPIVNGGVIILSGIAAISIFKERLSRKQLIDLILGILSVCFLGIS